MASRRLRASPNVWPGYVDALAALLMVVIFLLMIFTLAQMFLSSTLASRDTELEQLHKRLDELTRSLGLETGKNRRLSGEIDAMSGLLSQMTGERYELSGRVETLQAQGAEQAEALRQQRLTVASLRADIAALSQVRKELETRVGRLVTALKYKDKEQGQLRDRSQALSERLADQQERTHLAQEQLRQRDIRLAELADAVDRRDRAAQGQRQRAISAQLRVANLGRQIQALRAQLEEIRTALGQVRQQDQQKDRRIEDLGRRLNVALARRVNRLERYRSEFFGRLRQVLGDDPNVRVVGDRFVFQSELLFGSGSADLGAAGRKQLDRLATSLKDLARRIPSDLDWVLRVDGHTDRVPIHTERFADNWTLASARAVAVVNYLSGRGVPRDRLMAASFGDTQPLDPADTPAAYRRNRRIEFKLTSR